MVAAVVEEEEAAAMAAAAAEGGEEEWEDEVDEEGRVIGRRRKGAPSSEYSDWLSVAPVGYSDDEDDFDDVDFGSIPPELFDRMLEYKQQRKALLEEHRFKQKLTAGEKEQQRQMQAKMEAEMAAAAAQAVKAAEEESARKLEEMQQQMQSLAAQAAPRWEQTGVFQY